MEARRKAAIFAIGIDDYSEFQTLFCCSEDAVSFVEAFGARFGECAKKTVSSNESSSQQPNFSAVDGVLREISQLGLKSDDVAIFYFAGHGYFANGRDYLVCADTKRDKPETALRSDDIIAALTKSGAGTGILVIDACRLRSERDVGLFGEQTLELARRSGVLVFFGCGPGQTCQEVPRIKHGVFTYALLRIATALETATPLEIDQAVQIEVEKVCREYKLANQRPYTSVAPIQKAMVDIFTGKLVTIDTRHRRCLIIAGPCNAGKTTLGQSIASRLGAVHMEMSSFAWRRLQQYPGFEGTIQDFMEDVVWSGEQKDTIARELIANDPGAERIVICGPRTVEEIEALRHHHWHCHTIFLYANERVRHERHMKSAGHTRYDGGYRDFVAKDYRELGWGLARMPGLKDTEIVVNEGSVDDLVRTVARKLPW